MFYGNRFAGWTSARSECSFIFIFCFKHFHKFTTKKNIQAHTSIGCLLWSGPKERRKKLLQNLVDKNSGDLRRIVIYTLTLNKKCLGRFVWIADVFFKKYYWVGPPVLYPAKPSVHINKQTLFSLKVLIGLKLNISLCVSEGRENTNTSWVVLDRTGSGSESIKRSEWGPCERETRPASNSDGTSSEGPAVLSFVPPTMTFSSPLVVSLTLQWESDAHWAGLTTPAFTTHVSQQCALMALFAQVQYEGQAFSFFLKCSPADVQTDATKTCMQILSPLKNKIWLHLQRFHRTNRCRTETICNGRS